MVSLNQPQIPNEKLGNMLMPKADLMRYRASRPSMVHMRRNTANEAAVAARDRFRSVRLRSRRFRPASSTK